MARRHNNQLPNNLPQLQNLIKRDPESYREEFLQQWTHFQATLEIYLLHSAEYSKDLDELLIFLAQISHCYPNELSNYPQQLMTTLEKFSTVLEPNIRMAMTRALILMRNKNLLEPTTLLSLFFKLLHCPDKTLRKSLETHIMIDIKNVNKKHKNHKLNTVLQNFMFTMIRDSSTVRAAKTSLNIMIELYRKNIWNDTKTVNVIANAVFSKITKLSVTAIQFFLTNESKGKGKNGDESGGDSSDDDDAPNARDVLMANRVNKKTRKRDKNLSKVKTLIKKKKNKEKAPNFNFSALHLIHDPQGMAEKLFKQLESTNERFEVKLMTMDLISRLVGIHQLLLLNFYPYIKRFLQPHQREVTKIMQFVAQSAHELVPPDVLESVLQAIVNNFVTERNSGEVMAIGLNAIREICARCPLVMSRDLLQDLTQYKSYREKSVMMAARSLMHLFRELNPHLLHKKDKGKPTLATMEKRALQYGQLNTKDHVPGAEILLQGASDADSGNDSDADSDGSWIDVSDAGSGGDGSDVEDGDDGDEEEEGVEEEEAEEVEREEKSGSNKPALSLDPEVRRQLAAEVSVGKILTDEDFKRIETMQLRKEVVGARKGSAKKRKAAEPSRSTGVSSNELVDLAAIEMIHKKRRHDRDARLETVMKGREGREKFNRKKGRMNPHASTTDKEKQKKKPFMMIKSKLKHKQKKSFKERQASLRRSLLKQKKLVK